MSRSGPGSDVQVYPVNITKLRFIVFLLITAFIVVGPLYRQVLGGDNLIFRSWTMFSGIGAGMVDARFVSVSPDGSEVLLDRYEILDLSRNKNNNNPRNSRAIQARYGGALQVAERMCDQMAAGSVIKIHARVATKKGWKKTHEGSVLDCASKTLTNTD